jgi:hypothetical protein
MDRFNQGLQVIERGGKVGGELGVLFRSCLLRETLVATYRKRQAGGGADGGICSAQRRIASWL